MRVIDLSRPLVPGRDVEVRRQPNSPAYLGHECYAWDLTIRSHTGTYFETSSHVFRDGRHTADVSVADLALPCALVRLPRRGESPHPSPSSSPAFAQASTFAKATADKSAGKPAIMGAELEAAGAHVRKGDALLVDTGGDQRRYFERDAVAWMIARGIKLLGADLDRYDTGFEHPTGIFDDLFKADIPIIAGLANLDQLTRDRFDLIVAPLAIPGIGTVPARVFAIER